MIINLAIFINFLQIEKFQVNFYENQSVGLSFLSESSSGSCFDSSLDSSLDFGDGFLEVTIIINKDGSVLKKPIFSHKGIPSNGETGNFVFDLENNIEEICKTYSLKNTKQEYNLIEAVKSNCRKTIKAKTGKRPYTNVNLVRI